MLVVNPLPIVQVRPMPVTHEEKHTLHHMFTPSIGKAYSSIQYPERPGFVHASTANPGSASTVVPCVLFDL